MSFRSFGMLSALVVAAPLFAEEGYEGGKGLLTLEGPSGMFINPTSATMPAGYGTLQYCVFSPDLKGANPALGHGLMGSYGITDAVEVGAAGNYIDIDGVGSKTGGGPLARFRLRKDEPGGLPQVTLGGYSRFTDDVFPDGATDRHTAFLAAYKRLPVSEEGAVRAVGVHAGVRNAWLQDHASEDTTAAAYGGLEVQLPMRLYAVGEVTTKDSDLQKHIPFAYGLQWRAAGVAVSVAGIQNGGLENPSFFFGVGLAGSL